MPLDVQCLVGEFDALGLRFKLVAGEDPCQAPRALQRALLANYLRLAPLPKRDCQEPDLTQIRELFSQDCEWMVDHARYA